MDHEKLAKSHGILLISVMEFYQFCPQIVQNLCFFATTKKLSINVESPHFPTVSAKRCKSMVTKGQMCDALSMGHCTLKNVCTFLISYLFYID